MLTIRDLSEVLEPPLPEASRHLVATWEKHWSWLGKAQDSADAILDGIESLRNDTLELLRNLD